MLVYLFACMQYPCHIAMSVTPVARAFNGMLNGYANRKHNS